MYIQPLRLDSVAVEALLQIVGVFLLGVVPSVGGAVFQGGRFFHVVLADVVAIHGGVVDVQLEFSDPVTVPVGHFMPLDQELSQPGWFSHLAFLLGTGVDQIRGVLHLNNGVLNQNCGVLDQNCAVLDRNVVF